MNSNEIVKMIDTIRGGDEYTGGGDDLYLNTCKEFVNLDGYINDSRQAREIAAALVAWADHRDPEYPVEASQFLFEIARTRNHPEV